MFSRFINWIAWKLLPKSSKQEFLDQFDRDMQSLRLKGMVAKNEETGEYHLTDDGWRMYAAYLAEGKKFPPDAA